VKQKQIVTACSLRLTERKVVCVKSLLFAISGISIENHTHTHHKINKSMCSHILYSAICNLSLDTAGALYNHIQFSDMLDT